jgi:hypothetical protein
VFPRLSTMLASTSQNSSSNQFRVQTAGLAGHSELSLPIRERKRPSAKNFSAKVRWSSDAVDAYS